MTNITIKGFSQVTIEMGGQLPVNVDLSKMSNVKKADYINRLRTWKGRGAKGFPPAP